MSLAVVGVSVVGGAALLGLCGRIRCRLEDDDDEDDDDEDVVVALVVSSTAANFVDIGAVTVDDAIRRVDVGRMEDAIDDDDDDGMGMVDVGDAVVVENIFNCC